MKTRVLTPALLTLALPLLLATGCSTHRVMDGIMGSWVGAPLDAVVARWGLPGRSMALGDLTVYAWTEEAVVPVPAVTQTTATVAGGAVQATSVTTGGQQVTAGCTREVTVDASNTVVATGWRGNNCPFAEWGGYGEWRRPAG